MQTKTIQLRIDRIEEGLAVAFAEDGTAYTVRADIADLRENDIIAASVDAHGEILTAEILHDETAAKKDELRLKLKNLFNKRGN